MKFSRNQIEHYNLTDFLFSRFYSALMSNGRKYKTIIHIIELRVFFRYENSGIGGEHLRDGMPLKQVQRRIEEFLCNGEAMWKIRSPKAGKARILVGHHLHPLLQSLHLQYPSFMIR